MGWASHFVACELFPTAFLLEFFWLSRLYLDTPHTPHTLIPLIPPIPFIPPMHTMPLIPLTPLIRLKPDVFLECIEDDGEILRSGQMRFHPMSCRFPRYIIPLRVLSGGEVDDRKNIPAEFKCTYMNHCLAYAAWV